MIILPSPPRRAELTSFWWAVSLASGVLIACLSWFVLSPAWAFLGAGGALLIVLPGWLWPAIVPIVYNAWNAFAMLFARYARAVIMRVCFYVVFVGVGQAGSSLSLSWPDVARSQWRSRESLAPLAASPQRRWVGDFWAWATQTKNGWTLCLLPFLFLLLTLEREGDDSNAFPTSIYTLF